MVKLAKQKQLRIGPEDAGRRMDLDQFDHVIAQDGFLYELGKGVIEVSEIPSLAHGRQVQEIRTQITLYQAAHPDVIEYFAEGNDAKLLIQSTQSERHPDLLLYLSPAPDVKDVWSIWVPDIVIEVVSSSSAKGDYEEKPDEYLEIGISEYWIIDAAKGQMTALTRWRGQWKKQIVKPPAKYSSDSLPGFSLNLRRVLSAGKRK